MSIAIPAIRAERYSSCEAGRELLAHVHDAAVSRITEIPEE